ncbi:hypothetical protein FGIG_12093, partial [Fasciola gigantica]
FNNLLQQLPVNDERCFIDSRRSIKEACWKSLNFLLFYNIVYEMKFSIPKCGNVSEALYKIIQLLNSVPICKW